MRPSLLVLAAIFVVSGCSNDGSRRRQTPVVPPVSCAVTGICPDQGSVTGGEIVVITGTGFADPPTVHFGSIPSSLVTFVSGTEITAEAPPVVVGGVSDITVDLDTGATCTLAAAYVYRTVDPVPDALEPDDDVATCTNVPPQLAALYTANIDEWLDEDWFCFATIISGDRTVTLDLKGFSIDLDLEIYDSGGTFLMGSYNGPGMNEELVAPAGDTYSARVVGPCGEVGEYDIMFSG
jgi:hypothetical protein